MKKFIVWFVCVLLIVPSFIFAQVLEIDNSQELSKDARKGELLTFTYDQDSQNYTLIFKREKKKTDIYEIYQFDKDFKLLKNETLESNQAKENYSQFLNFVAPQDVWTDPMVVRVDPNWGGQIVLRQGKLTREWTKSVEDKGNYRYTTWYWKYNFNEIQNVKPKFEGLVDIPEGAPQFVINMAQKAGEKVVLLTYATDEPAVEVTTGKQNFVYGSLWARKKDYASASGDILIIGRSDQMDFDTKAPLQVFLSMKYSAEDLSQKHYETFKFDHMVEMIYNQQLGDGSIVCIFCPVSYPGMKNKDPNPINWQYVRVGADAVVKDKFAFENKGGWWKITNAVLSGNDEVLIYGLALQKKAGKYFSSAAALSDFDNVQLMKVANGEMSYLSTVSVKDLEKKLQKPGNVKKVKAYAGKDMVLTAMNTLASNGDLIFTGEATDHSVLYAFHFGADGVLKAHYAIGMDVQMKENAIDHTIFENPDQKTATFFIAELEKIDNGRYLKIPKIASIGLTGGTISDIETYGYGKKGKYYLDDVYPYTFIEDGQKVVFFSRDDKDASVWMGRVKLGN